MTPVGQRRVDWRTAALSRSYAASIGCVESVHLGTSAAPPPDAPSGARQAQPAALPVMCQLGQVQARRVHQLARSADRHRAGVRADRRGSRPGASAFGYDWVNRRCSPAPTTSPSSISQTPLRVSPVTTDVRGSRIRVYQKSLTSSPRSTPRRARPTTRRRRHRHAVRRRARPTARRPRPRGPVDDAPAAAAVRRSCGARALDAVHAPGRAAAAACPRRRYGSAVDSSSSGPSQIRSAASNCCSPSRTNDRPSSTGRPLNPCTSRNARMSATQAGSSTTS